MAVFITDLLIDEEKTFLRIFQQILKTKLHPRNFILIQSSGDRDVRLVVCPTTELQKKSEFCIENAPLREVKLGEFDQEILRKVRKNGVSKKP